MANLDELEEFQEYLENKYSEILVDGVLKSKKNIGMNEYERFQEQQKQAVIFENIKSFMAVEEHGTPYKYKSKRVETFNPHNSSNQHANNTNMEEYKTPRKYNSTFVKPQKPYK
jgi:predicted negative regulator of RcsB-dependent stress response